MLPGAVQEGQQLLQVILDALDGFGGNVPPVGSPLAESLNRLPARWGLVDRLGLNQAEFLAPAR